LPPQIESSLKEYAGTSLLLVSATSTASDNKVQEPIKVSGNIQNSTLIRPIEPIYPEMAKRNHVSGYVTLLISIDEAGNVAGIKVLRGDPALIDAAVAAVREWKYSPMLMDGSPVRAMGTVNVAFNLR
jgi:protein TonB